ncbi:MAG: hypothetical protein AB7U75_08195 [Hyphomicrobiaceae bacterium]
MHSGKIGEIVLHLYSGQPVRILATDVAYIDDDRDESGTTTGTRLVLSKVDDSGNEVSYRVKESCSLVAQQLSEIVGVSGIGDE